MPEGDTIRRTAATLREAVAGAEVTACRASPRAIDPRRAERLVGQRISAVEPRGKHLLCWFAPSGDALHTHLRMQGSWHLYRPGERWRKPARSARVVVETADWAAVCFAAPVVALRSAAEVAAHRGLAALGPDALDDAPDLAEARRRLDALAATTIGEALLDQRVLAGVGNVYRCEVLHRRSVHPWTLVAEVPGELRDRLLADCAELLAANLDRAEPRRTRPGAQRVAVHARGGRPCPDCDARVAVARLGGQARLVYWCPICQSQASNRADAGRQGG